MLRFRLIIGDEIGNIFLIGISNSIIILNTFSCYMLLGVKKLKCEKIILKIIKELVTIDDTSDRN